MRARSRVQHSWASASASAPRTNTRPIWERSKMPQFERTAACSARMPDGYCTGMSQPAKSTMRAPSRRCTALSGVASSSEGKPGTEDARQHRGDARELLAEQQETHADQQHATEAFDREHVRPHTPHHAERSVHGETSQQNRDAEAKRVHQ